MKRQWIFAVGLALNLIPSLAVQPAHADGVQASGSGSSLTYDSGRRWMEAFVWLYNPHYNQQFWGSAGVAITCYGIPFSSSHQVTAHRSNINLYSDEIHCYSDYYVHMNGGSPTYTEGGSTAWSNFYWLPYTGALASSVTHSMSGSDDLLGSSMNPNGGIWYQAVPDTAAFDDTLNPSTSALAVCSLWFNCACTCP